MQKLFVINNRKITKSFDEDFDFFDDEKDLQNFVQKNLEALLGIRYVASEYHVKGLRVDTVGIDANNCPVLIEYKLDKGDKAHGQIVGYKSLFLRSKDKFKLKVSYNPKLGNDISKKLNFSKISLICLARNFPEHVVDIAQDHKDVDLITYHFFHKTLLLEWIKGSPPVQENYPSKPSQPAIGKIQDLYETLSQKIAKLRHAEQHDARKLRRFKCGKTFVCLRPRKKRVQIWVKLNPKKEEIIPGFTRDVSDIMTDAGSCDLEISVATQAQLRKALALCRKAYREQKPPSSKSAPRSASRPTSNIKTAKRTLQYAISQCNKPTKALYYELSRGIANLGKDVFPYERSRLKKFKTNQLFAVVRPFPKKDKVTILVKLDPAQEEIIEGFTRDTTNIATEANVCPLEITVEKQQQVKKALDLCRKAYNQSKR